MLEIKHKDTKEGGYFLDTKTTSDLKVATKPSDEKLCGLCKQFCCSLYLPSAKKELCFFVSLCSKLYQLNNFIFIPELIICI